MFDGFVSHELRFWSGRLPPDLVLDDDEFEDLWNFHPDEFLEIRIGGKWVKTPRWQQAYGKDYEYTGQVNRALPLCEFAKVPKVLSILAWCRAAIDVRLNGALCNWYDGARDHYIGPHNDSTKNLIEGAPIVTVSLGETRVFRLRRNRGKGYLDFEASNGTIFVIPYEMNLVWKHEVPKAKKYSARRISVTLRAFETSGCACSERPPLVTERASLSSFRQTGHMRGSSSTSVKVGRSTGRRKNAGTSPIGRPAMPISGTSIVVRIANVLDQRDRAGDPYTRDSRRSRGTWSFGPRQSSPWTSRRHRHSRTVRRGPRLQ